MSSQVLYFSLINKLTNYPSSSPPRWSHTYRVSTPPIIDFSLQPTAQPQTVGTGETASLTSGYVAANLERWIELKQLEWHQEVDLPLTRLFEFFEARCITCVYHKLINVHHVSDACNNDKCLQTSNTDYSIFLDYFKTLPKGLCWGCLKTTKVCHNCCTFIKSHLSGRNGATTRMDKTPQVVLIERYLFAWHFFTGKSKKTIPSNLFPQAHSELSNYMHNGFKENPPTKKSGQRNRSIV